MAAADRAATRWLPTHFITLWMVDLPSGHGGRFGDLGWALTWTIGATVTAWAVAVASTAIRRPHVRASDRWTGMAAQVAVACTAAWRDARRNCALWALFVVVPVVFIWTADAVTPNQPITLTITEAGQRLAAGYRMPDVHGATMAPIAITSLAALVGVFALADNRDGDRRAALAGMRPGALLSARLGVLAVAALSATAISLAATAVVFDAVRWPVYAAANVLLALTYGLVGALPMLHPEPAGWAELLPGYGGSRILLDGALTAGFDETGPLLIGLGWLLVLGFAVALTYHHAIAPHRRAAT